MSISISKAAISAARRSAGPVEVRTAPSPAFAGERAVAPIVVSLDIIALSSIAHQPPNDLTLFCDGTVLAVSHIRDRLDATAATLSR